MKQNHKSKILLIISSIMVIIGIFIFLGFSYSKNLKKYSYDIKESEFSDNLRIIHISDLHYPKNAVALDKIEEYVKQCDADIIAMTGDIIDTSANKEDMSKICVFLFNLNKINTIYYILGNHEIGHKDLEFYLNLLAQCGVIYLENEVKITEKKQRKIAFIGVSDGKKVNEKNIKNLNEKNNCDYTILLAHRPELFDNYAQNDINLILSGHTHGGHARIFRQGFYAPNQGYFPRYSNGLYKKDNSKMIVSSGLSGNKRFYNPYGIAIINIS